MNKNIATTVRSAFALFLLGVGLYAGIDSLVSQELASRGLSSCGSAENPCALAPLQVTVDGRSELASHKAASPLAIPAAAQAPRAPRTALAES